MFSFPFHLLHVRFGACGWGYTSFFSSPGDVIVAKLNWATPAAVLWSLLSDRP